MGSHNKFYDVDYPHDASPSPRGIVFGHPYPEVQGSDSFAADYVKDENGDGGEWQAQSEYDRLRTKAQQEKQQQEYAEKRAKEAARTLEEAQEKMKKAHEEAEHANDA